MRVGLGVTVLARCLATGGLDGIGSYTRELLQRFVRSDELSVTPLSFGYPFHSSGCNETLEYGRFEPLGAASVFSGLPFRGSKDLREKVDLVHATDHLIPNFGRIPVVATLMDAIPLSHPEWVSLRLRSMKRIMWRRSAQWASRVLTISEYSAQELQEHFGINREKISVVPLGVDERWFMPVADAIIHETLYRYGLPRQFFLYVGTLQPRKNIRRLIAAYQSLPAEIKNAVPLVIVGRAGWQCEDIVQGFASGTYGKSVIWLKHLPDADLLAVLKAASALVFPSLAEGFGLPVVEAFAAGTPVITSNSTSLPEVAGEAALLVDPLDVSSIAEGMRRLIENTSLANHLRQKGLLRAKEYSWDRTAEMTLDVYKKVLSHN